MESMSKTIVVLKRKDDTTESILKAGKGEILKQFEKVCPTETSFQRMKKDMHDIFDNMLSQIQK